MRENVLQFYPSSPRNDLLDYYLLFQNMERELHACLDPDGVPSTAKEEYRITRINKLKSYGERAQKVIDLWAKVQAAEHKVAIEQGRVIAIPIGKDYGRRLSKHKYEEIIIYEHRHVFLPDTPENRALTTMEGFKASCSETMVLTSAFDEARSDLALKKKIQKTSEGVGAKFLFLGKALLLIEQALQECEKQLKGQGEKIGFPDCFDRLASEASEFSQYSKFKFIQKDKRTGARDHGLTTRDARLREVAKLKFMEWWVEGDFSGEPPIDELCSEFFENDFSFFSQDSDGERKANYEKFREMLADEVRCRILNDYFCVCGNYYPDSYDANAFKKINMLGSAHSARAYVAAHHLARKKAKAALGLIHGLF